MMYKKFLLMMSFVMSAAVMCSEEEIPPVFYDGRVMRAEDAARIQREIMAKTLGLQDLPRGRRRFHGEGSSQVRGLTVLERLQAKIAARGK